MSAVTPQPLPPPPPGAPPAVQRQIVLPFSKAVEIAWKSIRMRLSRSLLVTSGIILALAFLMAILAGNAMTDAMRRWASSGGDGARSFENLRQRRDGLTTHVGAIVSELHKEAAKAGKPTTQQAPFDPVSHFGMDLATLQKEVGPLPLPETELVPALTAQPKLVASVDKWAAMSRELRAVKDELTAPQQLAALMKANGVPTGEQEIASSRIQTRWLLGLALLVAFVGILNSMLMSVTERFREIGTMKCLGALDSFIIKLFLLESLFQGVVGTLAGIVVGLLLSLASISASYGGFAWRNVPTGELLAGVGICFLVGTGLTVAGAVYPAWQAARMQPIEAMRVET